MKFLETNGKPLATIKKELESAMQQGGDVLKNYSKYQNEISDDFKKIEEQLRGHGIKTPHTLDLWGSGKEVLEWKFYKPKNAKSGRFRLCFSGTPMLEQPFEMREYVHPYLPSFYMGLIEKIQKKRER